MRLQTRGWRWDSEYCQRALTQKQTPWGGGALERLDCRRRGQQLAQHDRSRHADALIVQVELRDGVLAQGDERDLAEVGHNGMLQHHLGQMVGCVTRYVVVADAVSPGRTERWYERHRKGMGMRRQRAGLLQSVCFCVSGR